MKTIMTRMNTLVPYLLYAAIIGILFFPAVTSPKDTYLFGWDLMDISYPLLRLFHDSIGRGVIPWWDPYIMAGHPYIGIVSAFTYPLFWVFAAFPVPFALASYYGIHIFLAMSGTYMLCRRWTGKTSAFFGGLVFGLSGFFFPRILTGVPDHIAVAAYLPFVAHGVFGFVEYRTLKKAIPGILKTGFFWGLMILVGDQRLGVMGAGVIFFVSVLFAIKQKNIMPILGSAIATFIGLGIGASQLLPLWENFSESIRNNNFSYEWASQASLTIGDFGQFLYPLTKIFVANTNGYPPFPEGPFYTGMLPLFLMIAGFIFTVIRIVRNRFRISRDTGITLMFLLLAVLSIWIAMGPYAPFVDLYRFLWAYVPMYKAVRVPFRFVLLFIFSTAIVSALTMEKIRKTWVRMLLIAVLLFELVPFAGSFMVLAPTPESGYDADLVGRMTAEQSGKRLHQNYAYTQRLGRVIDFDAPVTLHFYATNGNWPFISRNYGEFYLSMAGDVDESYMFNLKQLPPFSSADPALLNFLSVRYILSTGDFRPADNPALRLVVDNPYRWFTVYENTSAFPRYFPVYQATYLPDREAIKKSLSKREYDLSKTVLFPRSTNKKLSPCVSPDAGSVVPSESSVNEVRLTVSLPCDGYVVSSDVMYPGWNASVDGKRTEVLIGDLAFRTVFVPKGTHTVVYTFVPQSVIIGAIISFATFAVVILLYFRLRIRI